MKKLRLILLVSLLAFTSGGCGLFGQSGEEKPPEPENSPPDSSAKPPEKQAFEPKIPATNGAVYPLIPSTNPNERKQQIQTGRDNPFTVIAIKPVIKSKVGTNGVAGTTNGVAGTTNGVAGTKTNVVVAPKLLCKIEGKPPTNVNQAVESLPPPLPPVPNEARAVLVSGVLSLSGTPVAIIQAPGEKVARQVTTGAVLSNGQVFVKGINANVAKPYVILQQYGIDVARSVGQPPETPVAPVAPPAPKAKASTPPLGPNGFGKVKNLMLVTLDIGEVVVGEKETSSNIRASGILCNDGYSSIKVGELLLQVEDKRSNAVIDSFKIKLGQTYLIESGQKAEFDGEIPKLRGRKRGDVNIKLIGWN